MNTINSLETAAKKFEMIAPLLQPGLCAAEKRRLRSEIIDEYKISERTLRRYIASYKERGLESLTKEPRSAGFKAIPMNIINIAAELKKELPQRSIRTIVSIMEKEGHIVPGEISQSTLSKNLNTLGLTSPELKKEISKTARRFVREGRNTLWQSDIKYGPFIPCGDGKKKRTYLASFIDDATRVICHSEFYNNQRMPILEDAFRKALIKFGKPDAVYVDNGSQYTSRWFRIAMAKLGVKYMNAKPYSPESKGKIERFNGTVNEFMGEISLENVKSLTELNQKYRAWLDEAYQHKAHSGIKGMSPMECYQKDLKMVRFASAEECADAFLHEETRKVDKTGGFALFGVIFDAGTELIGKKIDVRFDPFDLSIVEVWHDGKKKRMCEPLRMGEFCGSSKKIETQTVKASHSRLISALSKENERRREKKMRVLNFSEDQNDDI